MTNRRTYTITETATLSFQITDLDLEEFKRITGDDITPVQYVKLIKARPTSVSGWDDHIEIATTLSSRRAQAVSIF